MTLDEELDAFAERHGGYWDGECPDAKVESWRLEVANGDTRLGYWEWAYAVEADPID